MSQPLSFPWPTWTVFGERAEPVLWGSPQASWASGEAGIQEAGMRGGQPGGVARDKAELFGQLKF